MRNTTEIKNKIINFLEIHGPSLPIHLSKEVKMDMIFTSAFLSELLSEKRINMTNLSIGSSRIYYLKGQEKQLEKVALENLKNKGLEAFQRLKENKFLENSRQEPAIKIALSSIPDFAKKIEKNGEIIWKYFLENSEFKEKKMPQKTAIRPAPNGEEIIKEQPKESEKKENTLEQKISKKSVIKDTSLDTKKTNSKKKIVKKKTSTSQKKNEKFFNTIKEYLNSKDIEILDIETFSKNNLILKIEENQKEILLVCFNKKRITDQDILNAHKKALQEGLNYNLLSLGEPTKKTTNFIEAIKNLNSIEKI
ncbi:MAG: hypothetical protein U9Q99_01125 [Nanoarchaeota archaeon]|nr:hypothetical protein [Nanoarchaeota archaeon]